MKIYQIKHQRLNDDATTETEKIPVKFVEGKFPAGEIYLRIIDDIKNYEILIQMEEITSDEIFKCIFASNAIKVKSNRTLNMILYAPYLPYGRQDKVHTEGEPESLKMMLKMLEPHFDEITSYDMHSTLYKNFNLKHNFICELNTLPNYQDEGCKDYIKLNKKNKNKAKFEKVPVSELCEFALYISPDKGAAYRTSKFYNVRAKAPCVIELDKKRVDDKVYTSYAYDKAKQDEYKKYIKFNTTATIVDDICDGGATFLETAKFIKKTNKDIDLNLILSHGIFSKGLDELLEVYENIYIIDHSYNRKRLMELLTDKALDEQK